MKKTRTDQKADPPSELARAKSLYEQYLELLWLRQQIERVGKAKSETASKAPMQPVRPHSRPH